MQSENLHGEFQQFRCAILTNVTVPSLHECIQRCRSLCFFCDIAYLNEGSGSSVLLHRCRARHSLKQLRVRCSAIFTRHRFAANPAHFVAHIGTKLGCWLQVAYPPQWLGCSQLVPCRLWDTCRLDCGQARSTELESNFRTKLDGIQVPL